MNEIMHDINLRFDHTLLKPDAVFEDISRLCEDARTYRFYGVCVNPGWVPAVKEALSDSMVKTITVAGFPLGANRTDIKVWEAVKGVSDGAHEVDMVANIGWLKDGKFDKAEDEIAEVRRSIPFNIVLKVIIECSLLTVQEQANASKAVLAGGAQFVKTGTGFAGPATVEQVKNIKKAVGNEIEIKAAGGIKTLGDSMAFIEAGASRIGCSATVRIMAEVQKHRE